jgi:hypothetical protein
MCILKKKIQKANARLPKQSLLPEPINVPYEELTTTVPKQNIESLKNNLSKTDLSILKLESITDQDLKLPKNLLKLDSCGSIDDTALTACNSQNTSRNTSASILSEDAAKPKRKPKAHKTRNPTKNISINYGKAIISFAVSHVALPYLAEFFNDFDYSYSRFVNFLKDCRKKMNGMHALKSFLIPDKKDNEETVEFKRAFQKISEVFINYFSINWITYGKVTEKLVYLKYRFKMLRRVRNPQMFTYIHKNHGIGLRL